ncbi:MAG: SUMF1/EgtB/PvdO family nonheme iron enzyme [Byssovorax sp.]
MDSGDGVDGKPAAAPEEREPDEAEQLIHRASGRRLAARVLAVLVAAGVIAWGLHVFQGWQRARVARKPPMVRVTAGTFRMGAELGAAVERPAHEVTLAGFSIDLTEVTVAAYRLCVDADRCAPSIKFGQCNWGREGRDDHPINCVDWAQAKAFCAWVGKRLPTEEEWEYAARGRDGRRFPWGDSPPGPRLLNACDKECGLARERAQGPSGPLLFPESDGWATTAPVGSYPEGESAFSARDLAGNVWEWTSSPLCAYTAAPASVSATTPDRCTDARKVTRGGGWSDGAAGDLESTARVGEDPTSWAENRGFRCIR